MGALLPLIARSSASGSQAVINAVVLVIAALTLVGVRRVPQAATLWWFVPLALVPAVNAVELWGVRVAPAFLFSVAILAGLKGQTGPRWTAIDMALAALGVTLLASWALGMPSFLINQGVTEWLVVAVAGRALATSGRFRVDHVAIAGAVLGVLAALQVVTRFDVAELIPSSVSGQAWAGLQYREGLVRAELGFGHSIALGAVLAMCLAFALRVQSRRHAVVMSSAIGVGVLATQSRSALLAALAVLALTYWTRARTEQGVKRRILHIGIPVGLLALPAFVYYFVLGGLDPSSEVTQGSRYRLRILSTIHDTGFLGLAGKGVEVAPGRYNWNGALSIDNAILYLALYAGWLVAIAYVTPMVLAAWQARRFGWNAATIALVCQVPLILTVAPITQYQAVFWLVVGVVAGGAAVTSTNRRALELVTDGDGAAPAAALPDVACVVVQDRDSTSALETIESLRRSGVPVDQIVVVDRAIDGDVSQATDHLFVVRAPGVSHGVAVNAGLDALAERGIEASFILVSASDVHVDARAVHALRRSLVDSPIAAVAGPTLVSRQSADIVSVGGELSLLLTVPRAASTGTAYGDTGATRLPVQREWLDGSLCLYDGQVLAEQRFRDDLFGCLEEAELHCRIRSTGRKVLWVPDARASRPPSRTSPWLLGRNLYLFGSLHGTQLGRRLATPWTIASTAVNAVLRRRNLEDVRSIVHGWQAARRSGFAAPGVEALTPTSP